MHLFNITLGWYEMYRQQVSANRGPDSTFAIKANIKSLCPKLSRGSILKSQNRVYTKHEYQPGSKMVEY